MMRRSLEDVGEAAIGPEISIIDAHHHLWDNGVVECQAPYLLDEFQRDLGSPHDVRATVYVECHARYRDSGPEHLRPVGETEFVNAIADEAIARGLKTRVAAGIVGFADLELGAAVDEVLEAHVVAAPTRFRGIRHYVCPRVVLGEYVDTEKRLLNPMFREGLRRLPAFDLTFDAVIFDMQFDDLIDTVRAVPEVTFILNHLGGVVAIGPYEGQRDAKFPAWQAGMARLAELPNVVVKLGGMGIFYTGYDFADRAIAPTSDEYVPAVGHYFHHAIDSFGPQRCMFESNFPPDKVSLPYSTLWNAFKKIAGRYTVEEQRALFSRTAERVYRL